MLGRASISSQPSLDGDWLRRLALGCGADDVGLVELERAGLDPQRDEIVRNYPWTRSLLSFVVRIVREPVRGAPRSVVNLEFHRAGHRVDEIVRPSWRRWRGVAFGPSIRRWASPWRCTRVPGHAIWVVSHKPVAVDAWARRLHQIVTGEPAAKVEPIRSA